MRNPATAHWRDSARMAKFFVVDARAAIPLLFFLLHIRLWTFMLAASITLFFAGMQKFGFTLPVFLRWVRVSLGGPIRYSHPWWTQYRNKR